MSAEVIHGDCLEVMAGMDAGSVDAVVTDPPYLLRFMSKEWDSAETDDIPFGMWLAGFIDGEGNFDIHRQRRPSGDYYYCRFEISLRGDDGGVLEMLKSRLGGKVYRGESGSGNGSPKARWEMVSRSECSRLAALLDLCPMQSKKARDFAIWREALAESMKTPGKNRPEAMAPYWEMLRGLRPYGGQVTDASVFIGPGGLYSRFAAEALRVLAPSHYLLAFGGTRTWHRLACALEDAGFEIRDTLMWLYGSGFPKGRACLKPAWEPVILARKPGPMLALGIEECRVGTEPVTSLKGLGENSRLNDDGWKGIGHRPEPTVSAGRWPANLLLDEEAAAMLDGQTGELKSPATYTRTVAAHGNIDWNPKEAGTEQAGHGDSGGASRFFYKVQEDSCDASIAEPSSCPLSGLDASALSDAATLAARAGSASATAVREAIAACTAGCANCTRTPDPALCAALMVSTGIIPTTADPSTLCGSVADAIAASTNSGGAARAADDSGPELPTRFLYSAKASRRERNAGLEGMEERRGPVMSDRCVNCGKGRMDGRRDGPCCDNPEYESMPARGLVQNHHPTVKPLSLMRYLCRLVTPPGGTVLDPFTGSGSTGCAAVLEGFDFIGIEREAEYVEIARRRIEHAAAQERLPV